MRKGRSHKPRGSFLVGGEHAATLLAPALRKATPASTTTSAGSVFYPFMKGPADGESDSEGGSASSSSSSCAPSEGEEAQGRPAGGCSSSGNCAPTYLDGGEYEFESEGEDEKIPILHTLSSSSSEASTTTSSASFSEEEEEEEEEEELEGDAAPLEKQGATSGKVAVGSESQDPSSSPFSSPTTQSKDGSVIETLLLHPDQVGGHFPLKKSAIRPWVYKMLNMREYSFYLRVNSTHSDLVRFLPRFRGVAVLSQDFESLEAARAREETSLLAETKIELHLWDRSRHHEFKNLDQLISTDGIRHIILDDLTRGFKMPCVLDLKLGTRQHGLDSSARKVELMKKRVRKSTSGTIGVRICGFKKHNSDNTVTFRDKYWGRKLSVERFPRSLLSFMSNGRRVRYEVIPSIVKELETLQQLFFKYENVYRFWSASLLIMYDAVEANPKVSVRMVDFAHVATVEEVENPQVDVDGFTFGMENLISYFKEFMAHPLDPALVSSPSPLSPGNVKQQQNAFSS